jgi:hypothetical protein
MTTWNTYNNITWVFDDGKMNLDEWAAADSDRLGAFSAAVTQYAEWKAANPTLDPTAHNGDIGPMIQEWAIYANAVQRNTN